MPITEDDIPNVFVSVLLVKGTHDRGAPPATAAPQRPARQSAKRSRAIPAKPAFRLGYVELKVEDRDQAADRRGRGEQRGVPAGEQRERSRSTSRTTRAAAPPARSRCGPWTTACCR